MSKLVYLSEYKNWKMAYKNLDKFSFYNASYGCVTFRLLVNDFHIATIKFFADTKDFILIDEVSGSMFIEPAPYFIFSHRLKKRLFAKIPDAYKPKAYKPKTFIDYLSNEYSKKNDR